MPASGYLLDVGAESPEILALINITPVTTIVYFVMPIRQNGRNERCEGDPNRHIRMHPVDTF